MADNFIRAMIGDGFLPELIISTFAKKTKADSSSLYVFGNDESRLNELRENYNVNTSNNFEELRRAKIIVTAFYPHETQQFLSAAKKFVQPDALIISSTYGVNLAELTKYFPANPIIRIMFTPVIIGGAGIIAYFVNNVNPADTKNFAEFVFSAFGKTIKVNSEKELEDIGDVLLAETMTAYSVINSMIESAMKSGLTEDRAREITAEIFQGAIKSFIQPDELTEYLSTRAGEEKVLSKVREEAIKIIDRMDMWNFAKSTESQKPDAKKILRFHYRA